MGQVFLDDNFPDHPKAQRAGDDAAWMFVCGLAYVSRLDTRGIIPKQAVGRLTGKSGPAAMKLAVRLVDVGLWHDMGDHYLVHDYEARNARKIARVEAAKKGAEARWRPPPDPPDRMRIASESHPNRMPTALPSQSDRNATAMPHTPGTKYPSNQVTNSHLSDTTPPDPAGRETTDPIVEQAITVLAERDLANTPTPIRNPDAWLTEARRRRTKKHADQLKQLLPTTLDAHQLAELLDPPTPPPAPTRPTAQGATQAAAQALIARHDRNRQLPNCPDCDNTGMLLADTNGPLAVAGRCHCGRLT